MKTYQELIEVINKNIDDKYRVFCQNLSKNGLYIQGVRAPIIKKIIKDFSDLDLSNYQLNDSYELVFIYFALALKKTENLEEGLSLVKNNIKYYYGWNLTDSIVKYFKYPTSLKLALPYVESLLKESNPFLRRTGYLILKRYEKSKDFKLIFTYFKDDEDYYVQMMESWLLCDLYIYHQEETFMFLKERRIGKIITNKTISKISDSYRVDEKGKFLAKTLKI